MGALPKRKISVSRKNKRRGTHSVKLPVIVVCPNCGRKMQAHNACRFCGEYRGKAVIKGKI